MLLSIVIPAYNAENSIRKAIDPLLIEKSNCFEIIVVNDGSKDNTEKICAELAARDDRLKVVNVKNGGVSKARNIGIDLARGSYITFLDADDEFADNWLSIIMETIEQDKSDLFVFGYKICEQGNDKKKKVVIPFKKGAVSIESFYRLLIENTKMNYCWGKVYSSDFIRKTNALFPVGIKIGEDVLFQIQVLENNPDIFASTDLLVNYNQNLNSVMHTFSDNKFKNLEDDYYFRTELLEKIGDNIESKKKMYIELSGILLSYLRQYTKYNGECLSILNKIRDKLFYKDIISNTLFMWKFPERIVPLILLRLKLYNLCEIVFKIVNLI